MKSVAKKLPTKHRCVNHPKRMPASSRDGVDLCWECLLPKKEFKRKCDENYYQPDGPGYAEKRRKDVRRWTMDESQTAGGAG